MQKKQSPQEVCKAILTNRRPELEQAIRQLAAAAGNRELNEEEISLFFQEVMDNCWDAFEEATCNKSPELQELNKRILEMESRILKLIGKENGKLMDRYAALVNSRDQHELEEAFLVGYQCAIRFVLMGIMPVPVLMQGYREREKEERDEVDHEA